MSTKKRKIVKRKVVTKESVQEAIKLADRAREYMSKKASQKRIATAPKGEAVVTQAKKKVFWLIIRWHDVETELRGPFDTYAQMKVDAVDHHMDNPEDGLLWLWMDEGVTPTVGDFSGTEMEETENTRDVSESGR